MLDVYGLSIVCLLDRLSGPLAFNVFCSLSLVWLLSCLLFVLMRTIGVYSFILELSLLHVCPVTAGLFCVCVYMCFCPSDRVAC